MITGSVRVLSGRRVLVVAQCNAKRNPDLARLRALMPLVRLRDHGPRNCLLADPDTGALLCVRPIRGLGKAVDHA